MRKISLTSVANVFKHSDGVISFIAGMIWPQAPQRFCWNGFRFLARAKDRVAFHEIVIGGEYSILESILPKTGTPLVIDVGANIGLFSLAVFRRNPACRVLALEPAPDTFQLLDQTRAINDRIDWKVRQWALFAELGTVEFTACGASTGRHISSDQSEDTVSVRSVTLELLASREELPEHIDLLKLDIEGAEEAVLAASLNFMRRVDCLVIELHDNVNQTNCLSMLRSVYSEIYLVLGRDSLKPLMVCNNKRLCASGLFRI